MTEPIIILRNEEKSPLIPSSEGIEPINGVRPETNVQTGSIINPLNPTQSESNPLDKGTSSPQA